ncbi:hypothetical protein QYE76_069469 [Lolium multiflorum]|uniref:Uncharacterized protein n=1 Tax=Lolium multiflorum TaxID=4521 RepID=A0AAD8WEX8_LOLMU|nr:hypothetical protein QYE76_069469 [Lolium multiflorum]
MAIGAGGIKPCVSSFGADQFDDGVPAERLKKSSFFNWFFFSIYVGSFVSGTVVVWVQDRCGWVIGLWIPTLFIALAIAYRQLLARFLDRFFWLIAALSSLSLAVFICCAKRIQVHGRFTGQELSTFRISNRGQKMAGSRHKPAMVIPQDRAAPADS